MGLPKLARTPLIVCFLVFGLASDVTTAQPFGNAERGATMSRNMCSECHGVDSGQRSRNPAAPTFEAIASSTGMTGLALEAALQSTHRLMPNVMLSREDRSDVIAYIQSLKAKN